jgi:flagellar hook-associated protein 2
MATTSAVSTTSTPSAASTTLTTAATTAALNKANAQKIITALGAGSGVDVTALAQGLVDAEQAPQANLINAKITANEGRVSGYAAVSFMLKSMNDALTAIKDANSFNASTISNSNTAAMDVTAGSGAAAGSYSVQINSIALPQRSMSTGFAAPTTALNGGGAFNLSLSIHGGTATTVAMAAGSDTPQGIVSAVNAAALGVTAQLVNTGDASNPYKIVLTGTTGAAQDFALTSTAATPSLPATALGLSSQQTATDANLTVAGVTYKRSTNAITDIIPGLTLNLKATTSTTATDGTVTAGTPVSLSLARDTTQIKTNITALATAYNDLNNILNEVSNPKSTLPTYGATLVGDSMVRQVRTQVRDMMVGTSSSPGTNVGALWQMGVSIDSAGLMAVDATKLDTALKTNFADVVTTFTGNQNNRTASSPPYSTSAGFASASSAINGGAAFSLSLVSSTGTFGVSIPADSTTPQGVVDAINASKQGFTAQLVQDTSGATPYKIMVMGSLGSSDFTLTAKTDSGTTVSGMGFTNNGSGVAGDALRKITALLSPTGALITQSAGATAQNDKLKVKLADLQTRMTALLARYTTQFSAMESLVGNINSQKASLKSSTDGMMAMYTNK